MRLIHSIMVTTSAAEPPGPRALVDLLGEWHQLPFSSQAVPTLATAGSLHRKHQLPAPAAPQQGRQDPQDQGAFRDTAWLLKRELMPFPEQVYEGTLYWGSAALVVTMMLWINRKARLLKFQIQAKVEQALGAGPRLVVFVIVFEDLIKLTTGRWPRRRAGLLLLFVNGGLDLRPWILTFSL